jgi:hypothetical protein
MPGQRRRPLGGRLKGRVLFGTSINLASITGTACFEFS